MIGLLSQTTTTKQRIKQKTNNMELLDKLNWSAAKAMNGTKVPQEKLTTSLKRSHLLQLQVVYNLLSHCNYKSRVKEKIRPISWNQSVVTDCSHLFVFAAWDTYTADRINKMFDLTNTIRDMKTKAGKIPSNAFKQLSAKDAEENFNHAAKQAYIAFTSNYCCCFRRS
jgi:hypothetical protein